MFTIFFVLVAVFGLSQEISEECEELFTMNDPSACCDYPMPALLGSQYELCNERCATSSDKMCCGGSCWDELYPMYVDGEVNVPNAMKVFANGIETYNKSAELWMPVVKESIKTCSKGGIFKEDVEDCAPFHYEPFTSCVMKMNFLNCPAESVYSSEACGPLKRFVKANAKCGYKSDGPFSVKVQYWYDTISSDEGYDLPDQIKL